MLFYPQICDPVFIDLQPGLIYKIRKSRSLEGTMWFIQFLSLNMAIEPLVKILTKSETEEHGPHKILGDFTWNDS